MATTIKKQTTPNDTIYSKKSSSKIVGGKTISTNKYAVKKDGGIEKGVALKLTDLKTGKTETAKKSTFKRK